MKFSVTKRIDNLGRIVVPIEMRKCYKIEINDEIELIPTEDGIIMKKKIKKNNPFMGYFFMH